MSYLDFTVSPAVRVDVGAPRADGWRTVSIFTGDGAIITVSLCAPNGATVPVNVQTGTAAGIRAARLILSRTLTAADVCDALTERERAALSTLLTAAEILETADGGDNANG